jgi:predicted house-cleaning noncanonical NTP pyrophosphatase (MazG superfamily)
MEENTYIKLVRDKIPEFLDSKGVVYEQEEYEKELFLKLDEEVKEFLEEKNNEELADIMEVINSIKKLPEFENVEEVRLKKLEEKGGFDKKIIVKGNKYK